MTREKGKRLDYHPGDYVVFDLETTGLVPGSDRIIEISGIKVIDGHVEGEFSTLVNPEMHIPYAATRVNGITDKMVQDAPTIGKALADFLAFAGKLVLVGHNIHTFDTNFIYDSALLELGQKIQNDYVDTLYLSRSCLPMLRWHKLTDIAAHFGISTDGAHRALADCHMNYLCYVELGKLYVQKMSARKIPVQKSSMQKNTGGKPSTPDPSLPGSEEAPDKCCPECGCLLVQRKGRYGTFWGCTGYPTCRYTRK